MVLIAESSSTVRSGVTRFGKQVIAFLSIVLCSSASASRAVDGAATSTERGTPPPNVLFISVDDLNDWTGFLNGHPNALTPRLDQLAQRGVWFTRAYCNSTVCNSSRTSMVTGMRPTTLGVYSNNSANFRFAFPDLVTIPEHFRNNGYQVLGGQKFFHHIDMRGWDTYFGCQGDPKPPGAPTHGIPALEPFDWGPLTLLDTQMPDGKVAMWAVDFLSQPQSQPFFLAVGFSKPHLHWYVPQAYFDLHPLAGIVLPTVLPNDVADVPPEAQSFIDVTRAALIADNNLEELAVQGMLAATTFIDAQIGAVLDALDNGPHAGNTIIVLFSDHGHHMGEKGHWAKSTLWERSIRVPFIIVAPGVTPVGVPSQRVVSMIDIYPTLIELCGLPARPELDGTSLVPLLLNPDMAWEIPAITSYLQPNYLSVRTEQWRYTSYSPTSEELYDHNTDPNEWVNLSDDPSFATVKSQLAALLPQSRAPEAIPTPSRLYVDADATGANTGASWTDALNRLDDALQLAISALGQNAGPVEEIWVAAGTYRPAPPGGSREVSFLIPIETLVFGGFAGNEIFRNQRNPEANPTILSGDLNQDDLPGFGNRGDNSYHVVRTFNYSNQNKGLLDGFHIRGGQADGPGWHAFGGGVYLDHSILTISSCRIYDNRAQTGGGVFASGGGGPATFCLINNSILNHNSAVLQGGAVFCAVTSPAFHNCNYDASAPARPTIVNCSVYGNTAPAGGGLGAAITNLTLANSILWENSDAGGQNQVAQLNGFVNPVIQGNLIQGWTGSLGGVGNSGSDPQFVDPLGPDGIAGSGDEDFRLRLGSPAVDAGRNSMVPLDEFDIDADENPDEPLPLDVMGATRLSDHPMVADTGEGLAPIIDIGAHENQALVCALLGDVNVDASVDAADIHEFLNCLIAGAPMSGNCPCADLDQNNAIDNLDVAALVSALLAP